MVGGKGSRGQKAKWWLAIGSPGCAKGVWDMSNSPCRVPFTLKDVVYGNTGTLSKFPPGHGDRGGARMNLF